MCVRLERSFFSKIPLFFRSETEKRTSGASETASGGRTPARRAGGAKPRQAKPLPKPSGASERRREATEGRRPSLTERAERASICRQSQVASNSAVEKCSLFVVSSTNWAAACRPYRRDTEKRRNGTEAAPLFCCHLFMNTRVRLPKR